MKYNGYNKIIKIFFLSIFVMIACSCYKSNASSTPINSKPVKDEVSIVVAKEPTKSLTKPKVFGYGSGDFYLNKYMQDSVVHQILLIEQSKTEQSIGKLCLLFKTSDNHWVEKLQCKAYLGKNGIDKSREGDKRTPTGDYGMIMAFGVKDDPGSIIPYTKLTNTMYLCGDKEYYNQFIDVSKIKHTCSKNSEHLVRYVPQYNYALFFDYNKENIFGKGSAIFLHCFGNYPYTLGCISVAEENMVKILRTIDKNARICIYPFQ